MLQNPPYRVRGCILTVMERLDEEFTKMLQACDAHSTEFVERSVGLLISFCLSSVSSSVVFWVCACCPVFLSFCVCVVCVPPPSTDNTSVKGKCLESLIGYKVAVRKRGGTMICTVTKLEESL